MVLKGWDMVVNAGCQCFERAISSNPMIDTSFPGTNRNFCVARITPKAHTSFEVSIAVGGAESSNKRFPQIKPQFSLNSPGMM
jgi:hypothetical protein